MNQSLVRYRVDGAICLAQISNLIFIVLSLDLGDDLILCWMND